MGRRFEQEIMIPLPPEQVAAQAQHVLAALPKGRNVWVNPPVVGADTGIGALSWGEKLQVQLAQVQGGTSARISSECAFPLQLIDYGKNRKNVEQIVAGLQIPQPPAN